MRQKLALGAFLGFGLTLGTVATWPRAARGDDVYTFIVKKQEEKKKTRWSLSDWLETRDRMRLMDLWLALHTPTPFEFYLEGAWRQAETDDRGRLSSFRGGATAYATIFGLGIERGMGDLAETLGRFDLRFFGYHSQGTNLTLQGGIRSRDIPFKSRQAFTGISATIYLAKYFGIDGLYRHYFKSVPDTAGIATRGARYEGGAFIDFKFLRLYGTYFSEPERRVDALGATQKIGQTGFEAGTRLYF